MPFAVGGGIKTLEDAKSLITAGAEKVVLNSHAITNTELIGQIAEEFGNQSVVVAIDVKKENGNYIVYTHSGSVPVNTSFLDLVKNIEQAGAGEILINSIDKDGTKTGYDYELVELVSNCTQIPIIASGGASDWDDFPEAIEAGAAAVAAGTIFVFIGKKRAVLINYPERDEINDIFYD